jgi:cytochrome b6-f complex iron-sulfur subunit
MERNEFLSKMGIGLVAVCAGCSLVACGGKGSNPSPSGGMPPPKGSGTVFTVDLSSQIPNVGDSTVSNGIILVRIAADNTVTAFTAVQVACTHQGTAINYNQGQGIFICPLHGSEFSKSGAVLVGPAALSLQKYNVAIDGNTLTVSA